MIVVVDTREQRVPPFPDGVELERRTLPEGDYSTPALFDVARIERKSVADFGSTITWGRERFDREVQRLQAFRWKCIVVEGSLSDVYRDCAGVHPHAVLGTMASMLARHDVPVLFALNPTGCGRLMAGLLRRWEERVIIESGCKIPMRPAPIKKTRPKAELPRASPRKPKRSRFERRNL